MKDIKKAVSKYNKGKDLKDWLVVVPLPMFSDISDMLELNKNAIEIFEKYSHLMEDDDES